MKYSVVVDVLLSIFLPVVLAAELLQATLGQAIAIVLAVIFVNGLARYFQWKACDAHMRAATQDAMVFATVIKKLWKDDPIMANAVWKKAVPNIPPPWHTNQ